MRQGVTALQAARTGASRGEEEEQRAERQLLADISVIVGITEQHCTFLKGLLQRRPPPLKSRSSSSIGASISSVGGSEAGASSGSGGGHHASAGRLQFGRGGPPAPPPAPPGVRPQQIQTRSGDAGSAGRPYTSTIHFWVDHTLLGSLGAQGLDGKAARGGAAGGKGSRTGSVERGTRADDSHEQDADGAPAVAVEWDPGPRADAGAEPLPLEEVEAAKDAEARDLERNDSRGRAEEAQVRAALEQDLAACVARAEARRRALALLRAGRCASCDPVSPIISRRNLCPLHWP